MPLNYSPAGGYGTQAGNQYFVQTPAGGTWSNNPASQSNPPATLGFSDARLGAASNTSSSGGPSNSGIQSEQDKQQGENDRLKADQERAAQAQHDQLMAQIDSEFGDVMGQISQEEGRLGGIQQSLTSQLPITEGQITQGFDETKPVIEQARGEQLSNLQGQATTAQGQTTGLIGKARQLYNELSTGGQRYAGSSTGQAYGEILGRTTAQQIGEARSNLANTLQQVEQEKGRTVTFYNSKLQDLEKNKKLAIQQARQDFQVELNKLSQAKVGLGQSRISAQRARAQQNVQALAGFQQQVFQINDAATTAERSLRQWAMDKQSTLEAAKAKQVQQYKLSLADMNKIPDAVDLSKPGAQAAIQNAIATNNWAGVTGYLKPEQQAPVSVGSGSSLVDPQTGKVIYQGQGGGDTQDPFGLGY